MLPIKSKLKWQTYLPIVFFLALIIFGARFLNDPALPEKVATWGIFAPLGIILLKMSTIIIAPLGGNPIYLAAPKFFGVTQAIIYLIIGDMLGYTTAFLLARKFGNRILKRFLSDDEYEKAHQLLTKVGTWKNFFWTRLGLFPLSDVISYAAGLTKLPFLPFFIITAVGVIAYVFLMVFVGRTFVQNTSTFLLWTFLIGIIPLFFFSKQLKK